MTSVWVITAAAPAVELSPAGIGETTFTVTNNGSRTGRAVLDVVTSDGADPQWFTVIEPQRAVPPGGSVSYVVRVAINPSAAPGSYSFQGRVYSVDEAPEENSVLSGRVSLSLARAAVPVPKKRPWWILAVAALVVVVVGVVTAVVLASRSGPSTTTARPAQPSPSAPTTAQSALRFGGNDGILLGNPEPLQITGTLTVEAWIRPSNTNALQDVVAHGFLNDPAHRQYGEVALRIAPGGYEFGTWNNVLNPLVRAPIPAGDNNIWVHLAGTFDGGSWRLYRNGVQVASTASSQGAYPVNADWAIGMSGKDQDRKFTGDIDDVRIFNYALDAKQIADTMGSRLTGTEAGLVGNWYVTGGKITDHGPNQLKTTTIGSPKVVTGPPVH
jgi:hypothetical protein